MLTETYIKQILSINAPYSYGHEQRINTVHLTTSLHVISDYARVTCGLQNKGQHVPALADKFGIIELNNLNQKLSALETIYS